MAGQASLDGRESVGGVLTLVNGGSEMDDAERAVTQAGVKKVAGTPDHDPRVK